MKKVVKINISLIIIMLSFLNFSPARQNEVLGDDIEVVMNNVRTALKNGSSKGLSEHFNNVIELKTDGNKRNVSKNQAEFILKDFFRKNAPQNFELIHKGESEKGMKYLIGKYSSTNKNTFRVYIVVKKVSENYLIHKLEFTKE